MRTALLAWDYPPSPSGLSTAAREIAESLVSVGCEVTVFTLDRTGRQMAGPVEVVGCEIPDGAPLARMRLLGGLGHVAAPLAFRRAVMREHGRRPFRILEATNWYAPAALIAGARTLPVVTRNSTPAAFSRDAPESLRDRIDGYGADRLERRQARASAGLISNTRDHGERMRHLYGFDAAKPHATIGLSLAPDFLSLAGRAAFTEAEPVRLLFVGRAEHRKGFDALMEAAAILGRECDAGALPEFVLRLVGVPADDLPTDLPDAARRRVEPLGRQPGERLAVEYEAAHIVAAPSRYESFGLVYQEALAYGRAVVASAEDASARQFVGGAGVLARETSGPALADALRPLIASAERRAEARRSALEAAGRFTRETLGHETRALYEEVLARHQAR